MAGWTHSDYINLTVAAGTLGLAATTGFLAWKTRGMERATWDMATATRQAMDAEDERLVQTLTEQERARQEDRAFDAAMSIVESIEVSGLEPGTEDTILITAQARQVRARLSAKVGLVTDEEVQSRVRALMALLQLLQWTERNLFGQGLTRDEVAALVPNALQILELTLQAWVSGQELPQWYGPPPGGHMNEALDWVAARGAPPPATNQGR